LAISHTTAGGGGNLLGAGIDVMGGSAKDSGDLEGQPPGNRQPGNEREQGKGAHGEHGGPGLFQHLLIGENARFRFLAELVHQLLDLAQGGQGLLQINGLAFFPVACRLDFLSALVQIGVVLFHLG